MAKHKNKKVTVLDPAKDFDKPVKQDRLPGMKDAAIEEIEEAAGIYDDLKYRRIAALQKEIQARDLLLAIMKKHGRASYHRLVDDRWLHVETIETKEKVRVKFNEEAPEGGEIALSDNSNPGGAAGESQDPAPKGDQEQPEVAGASAEVSEESNEDGGEAPPF